MNRNILAYSLFVFVIGLIAVGCGGGGGGGSANPVAATVSTGSVANLSGVVSLENVPLANAKVYLYPAASAYMAGIAQLGSVRTSILEQTLNNDGSYSTYTDALGKYSFTNIPVGNYTLIAARDQNHQFARTNVILGAVTQLDAQLTPTGSVTGRIQILVGNITENVSGAIVYLDGTSYVAVSGLDGTFTIANVPANQSFNLKVISSRGIPTTSPAVSITPGSSFNAGTVLLAAPTVVTSTLSGQVEIAGVAAPDAALAGHMVLLTSENQAPLINLTDENGNFAFIVRAGGAYRVTPIPEEYDSVPFYQNINIVLGENAALSQIFALQADPVDQVNFIVDGSVTKNGKAFDEADEGGVPLTLTETSTGKTYAAITTADGSFNFEVPSGEYELAVGGGYTFETPLTQNPFPVAAPLTVPAFNIVPTKNVIMVQGSIFKNSKTLGETDEAGVALMLTSIDAVTYPSVTDADGNFTFFVPAGDYSLSIGGAYQFVNHPFAGSPLTVPVNAAQQAILNVPLEVTPIYVAQQIVSVRGYVQDAGTNTIAGVNLTLTDTADPTRVFTAISNAVGDFSFEVLPGNYELSVVGQYQPAAALAAFDTDPSGLHNLGPITVVPTGITMVKVQGQVVDGGGLIVAGVNLTLTDANDLSQVFAAISNATGDFSFEVPSGTYDLTAVGRYQLTTVLSPFVTSDPNGINDLGILSVASTDIEMVKVQGQVSKNPAETDDSGVNLTLTDMNAMNNVYSAMTNAGGYYSFEVPSGTYRLEVVGNYISAPGSPFDTNDASGLNDLGLLSVSPVEVIFTVSGAINKTTMVPGDSGPVEVLLRSPAVSYETITSDGNNFEFKVRPGVYNLEITGLYQFDTAPTPIDASSGNVFLGTLNVSPSTSLDVVIGGAITAVTPEPFEVRLWDEINSKYAAQTNSVRNGGVHDYRFAPVPAGTYRVVAFPHTNGFFAETPVGNPIVLAAGEKLLNHNLAAVKMRPDISTVSISGNIISLAGNDFSETTPNPSTTGAYVSNNRMPRPTPGSLVWVSGTSFNDQADVSSLPPGDYLVEVRRNWSYVFSPSGVSEDFVLRSNTRPFTKDIQPPTNLVFEDVTDHSARFTWKNAPWTQATDVQIYNVTDAFVFANYNDYSGNSLEIASFSASKTYEVRLLNKAGSKTSALYSSQFTTKSTASTKIQQVILAGSSTFSSIGVIDFAAGGGDFFFAYGFSTSLNIAKYNASGVLATTSLSISAPMASNDHVSLVYDSVNSALYLSYYDGNGIVIEAYNPADLSLTTFDNTSILGDKAKLVCSNGKLFVASSDGATYRLNVYSAPTLAALGVPSEIGNYSDTSLPVGPGYLTSICADEANNSLYFITPFSQVPSTIDSYQIRKFSLTAPVSPGQVTATVSSNRVSSFGIGIRQFEAGAGKIYLRTWVDTGDPTYEYMYFIDQNTGTVSQRVFGDSTISGFAGLGDFGVDSKGRIWMGEGSHRFVQLNFTGTIFQDLTVPSFISQITDNTNGAKFPNPANFIKIDPVNNNMNMLFLTSSFGDLAVYRYTTDY